MSDKSAKRDRIVAEIAARQHGVVSVRQLRLAGFDRDDVLHRVRVGRLHPLHRGVYAVGHPGVGETGRWMAAVLACGGGLRPVANAPVLDAWGAALGFRSAAVAWGLLPPRAGPIDVSVPSDGGRCRREGIRVHRCRALLPVDVTLHRGLPVTKPARTLADLRLAASAGPGQRFVSGRELHRAIRQAEALGLSTGLEGVPDRARSGLERRFRRLCRANDLPMPEHNVPIGPHEVDFLWRERKLVVETDGYQFHRGRTAFEDDRARDLDLRARGFEVVRSRSCRVRVEIGPWGGFPGVRGEAAVGGP